MKAPKISVILPVKNGAHYLQNAITSVLNQSFSDFELLIIDDGSTDDTADIIERNQKLDSRVRPVETKKSGFACVLNEAMQLSEAPYVARLDADDEMHRDRLESQYRFLEENPKISLCATYVYYISPEGKSRGIGGSSYHSPDEIRIAQQKDLVIGFQHPSVMFRRDNVLELGGYREGMWPVEDVDLWTRMVEAGLRLSVMKQPLTNYRVHESAGSRTFESILKLDWVKQCVRERRAGAVESSWEEFLESVKNRSWWERLCYKRKTTGKYYYRRGAQNWLIGNRFSGVLAMTGAFLLSPSHIKKRFGKFRLGKPKN